MLARRQKITSESEYPSTRDQLIIEHLPYVKHIVHRIAIHLPSSVEIEDLINVGIVGLIEAADRYDAARDNKFATYAAFRIRGAVLSELRSRDFLSKGNRRRARQLEATYLKLEQKYGTEVDDDEVANELGVSLGELYQLKKLSSMSFISLE
jgi:RNA polymerase sigma factor for flagellar operon FliA